MSDLKEFSMNMPMIGVTGVGAVEPTETSTYDVTSAIEMPADIASDKVDHIYVGVDSATISNYSASDPMVCVDMVLTVGITNPNGGESMNYKMVKRLKLDKAKLAYEAESLTPIVVEEDDPLEVAKLMEAFYKASRAREMAGLAPPVGTKTFEAFISFGAEELQRETATVQIGAVRDHAHARHVFELKHSMKYPNVKIARVVEVV